MDYKFIFGIFIFVHGIYSLYSSYKGEKSRFFTLPSYSWLPKKIFGKQYNRVDNLIWGSIELFIGFQMIKFFLFN